MPGSHEDCPVNELRADLKEVGILVAYEVASHDVETSDRTTSAIMKKSDLEIAKLLQPYKRDDGLTEEGQLIMQAAQNCRDRLYSRDDSCREAEAW